MTVIGDVAVERLADYVTITPPELLCQRRPGRPTAENRDCHHREVRFPWPAQARPMRRLPDDRIYMAKESFWDLRGPQAVCLECGAEVDACPRCGGYQSQTSAELPGRLLVAHLRGAGIAILDPLQRRSVYDKLTGRLVQCVDCGLAYFEFGWKLKS